MKFGAYIMFLLMVFLPNLVGAQGVAPAAFSQIAVGGGLIVNSNENRLHNFWSASQWNGKFRAITPFYWGDGCTWGAPPYVSRSRRAISGLCCLLLLPGIWRRNSASAENIPCVLAGVLGMPAWCLMRIAFIRERDGVAESEMLAGFSLMVDFQPTRRLGFYGGIDYLAVFTRQRIELTFLTVGANLHFDSPKWLQDFLR